MSESSISNAVNGLVSLGNTMTPESEKLQQIGPKHQRETPFVVPVKKGREFTDEDRAKGQAKIANRRAAAAINLRRNFADSEEWESLARKRRIRLPDWSYPMTVGGMRKWMKRLGLTNEDFKAWSGFKKYQEYIDANPSWPLRSYVGLMLELRIKE